VTHFCFICTTCQIPSCQTAPLLPSVTGQQNVKEYWWEGSTCTAVPPTSASDVVGRHNKIAGSTFGAALPLDHLLEEKVTSLMSLAPVVLLSFTSNVKSFSSI